MRKIEYEPMEVMYIYCLLTKANYCNFQLSNF